MNKGINYANTTVQVREAADTFAVDCIIILLIFKFNFFFMSLYFYNCLTKVVVQPVRPDSPPPLLKSFFIILILFRFNFNFFFIV